MPAAFEEREAPDQTAHLAPGRCRHPQPGAASQGSVTLPAILLRIHFILYS